MDEISVRLGQIQYALRTPMVPAVAYTGPGDVVTSAVAWWGLRAYSNSTKGSNAVRIRRTSDNAESDFTTASDGTLNRASILTFLSGTDGRIVTLYDQTGNARPVTQATAASQPIVNCMGMGLSPVLLLHMDGSDTSTTFTDSSGRGHVVTVGGNAQIDTAQSVFGGSSALFDGAGDSLLLDGSTDFAFGLGDFTIDFRLRFNSITGGTFQSIIDFRDAFPGQDEIQIYMNGSAKLVFWSAQNNRITSITTVTTGVNYHVRFTRSGGITRMFINGSQEGGDYTDTTNYAKRAGPVIGAAFNLSIDPFNGWIDEFALWKGSAQSTGNFTVPTSAYTVSDDKVVAEFVAGSVHKLESSNVTQAQPFSASATLKYLALATQQCWLGSGTGNVAAGFERSGAADTTFIHAGGNDPVVASANMFHAIQGIYNGSSSFVDVDGGSDTSAPTTFTNGYSATPIIIGVFNSSSQPFNGLFGEAGLWPSANNATQADDLSSNQRTFWGFGSYTGPGDIV